MAAARTPRNMAIGPAVATEPAAWEMLLGLMLLTVPLLLLDEEAVFIEEEAPDVVVARVAADVMVPTVPDRAVVSSVMVGSSETVVASEASALVVVAVAVAAISVVITDSWVEPAAAAVDVGVESLP